MLLLLWLHITSMRHGKPCCRAQASEPAIEFAPLASQIIQRPPAAPCRNRGKTHSAITSPPSTSPSSNSRFSTDGRFVRSLSRSGAPTTPPIHQRRQVPNQPQTDTMPSTKFGTMEEPTCKPANRTLTDMPAVGFASVRRDASLSCLQAAPGRTPWVAQFRAHRIEYREGTGRVPGTADLGKQPHQEPKRREPRIFREAPWRKSKPRREQRRTKPDRRNQNTNVTVSIMSPSFRIIIIIIIITIIIIIIRATAHIAISITKD